MSGQSKEGPTVVHHYALIRRQGFTVDELTGRVTTILMSLNRNKHCSNIRVDINTLHYIWLCCVPFRRVASRCATFSFSRAMPTRAHSTHTARCPRVHYFMLRKRIRIRICHVTLRYATLRYATLHYLHCIILTLHHAA